MRSDPYDLDRFVMAQAPMYDIALSELIGGRKVTHWMWFVFPQLRALGRSGTALRYGIASLAEARAYLAHPLLGARYAECVEAIQDLPASDPVAVFGEVDTVKLRSSLTLFEAVSRRPLFSAALIRWFGGERDERTLGLLSRDDSMP